MVNDLSRFHILLENGEPKSPQKRRFFAKFRYKTLEFLEFYQGWVYSKTLFHSQTNRLTNDFAPLNPSKIFTLFRKWCTSPSKVPKITAYAITSDVIGHDVTVDPDISSERSWPELSVAQTVWQNNDWLKKYKRFFEPFFGPKSTYKSQKLTSLIIIAHRLATINSKFHDR